MRQIIFDDEKTLTTFTGKITYNYSYSRSHKLEDKTQNRINPYN